MFFTFFNCTNFTKSRNAPQWWNRGTFIINSCFLKNKVKRKATLLYVRGHKIASKKKDDFKLRSRAHWLDTWPKLNVHKTLCYVHIRCPRLCVNVIPSVVSPYCGNKLTMKLLWRRKAFLCFETFQSCIMGYLRTIKIGDFCFRGLMIGIS